MTEEELLNSLDEDKYVFSKNKPTNNFNITVEDAVFKMDSSNKVSIDLTLEKLEAKREDIKNTLYIPLRRIKDKDHFFIKDDAGALFYNSYRMSIAKTAAKQFELIDTIEEQLTSKAKRLYESQKKIDDIKIWQQTEDDFNDYIDEQNKLGNRLPAKYKRNVFWNDFWFTTKKLLGCTIFLPINLYILPGKLRRHFKRIRKEKNKADVGTHAGSDVVKISSKRAELAETAEQQLKPGEIALDAPSGAVLDAVERAETEKTDGADKKAEKKTEQTVQHSEQPKPRGKKEKSDAVPQQEAINTNPSEITIDKLNEIIKEVENEKSKK